MFSTFCPSLEAQWPVDPAENMQILINAINPVMVSDGFGGAIVVAPVLVSYPYLVAQRVDKDGYILWDKDLYGIEVAQKEELDITGAAQLLPDGHGGVFVAYNYCSFIGWIEEPPGPEFDYDVYVQHIDSSGTVLWGDRGVPVCTLAGNQTVEGIVTDAEGGMIVIWTDGGTYAQRVSGNGEILWQENGEFLSDMFYNLGVSDGIGGMIMFLISSSTSEKINPTNEFEEWYFNLLDRRFQRINKNGEVVWSRDIDWDFSLNKMISDDSGGAVVVGDYLCGIRPCAIKMQRIDSIGNEIWKIGGVIIFQDSVDQIAEIVVTDGNHGAYVSWSTFTWEKGESKRYTQRIDNTGTVVWGEPIIGIGGTLVADGVGGIIISYYQLVEEDDYDYFAQRFDKDKNVLWDQGGILYSLEGGASRGISDGREGGIFVWYVTGVERGTYTKRVDKNGNLGGSKGDVNLDGTINILDVVRVVNIILGNPPSPTEYELWAADFNEDDQIDIVDVIGIVDRILGLDPR